MSDEVRESHCIRVLYEAHYPHATGKHTAEVLARGDGTLNHWLKTFRAALISAGYQMDVAKRLQFEDAAEKARAIADGERLEWLMRNVSGEEFRRLGIVYSAGCERANIDQAICDQAHD